MKTWPQNGLDLIQSYKYATLQSFFDDDIFVKDVVILSAKYFQTLTLQSTQ